MTQFSVAAARYLEWVSESALPLWGTTGIGAHGGSVEKLDPNGRPNTTADLRIRVQARQAYVFAVAAEHKWYPEARARFDSIETFMQRYGKRQEVPGYWHLLTPELGVKDQRVDLYDYAFFLLSRAWKHRITADESALDEAAQIMRYLDSALAADNGGWREGDYAAGWRRQNPHMHLLEACLALFDTSADPQWLRYADDIMVLFDRHFFAPEPGVLLEYFSDDWQSVAASDQRAEPGHMLEWVWLLHWHGAVAGTRRTGIATKLYKNALRFGQSPTGIMFDELDSSGRVLAASKRLWPMTELIKAAVCEAIAGDEEAWTVAAAGIDGLLDTYCDVQTPGAYIDRLDPDNKVTVAEAPASSMYHLIAAAREVARGLDVLAAECK